MFYLSHTHTHKTQFLLNQNAKRALHSFAIVSLFQNISFLFLSFRSWLVLPLTFAQPASYSTDFHSNIVQNSLFLSLFLSLSLPQSFSLPHSFSLNHRLHCKRWNEKAASTTTARRQACRLPFMQIHKSNSTPNRCASFSIFLLLLPVFNTKLEQPALCDANTSVDSIYPLFPLTITHFIFLSSIWDVYETYFNHFQLKLFLHI